MSLPSLTPRMSKITELFGHSTLRRDLNWLPIVEEQKCPFLSGRKCTKTRKGDSSISIGTCSILVGSTAKPVVICPVRLTQHRQVFIDCLHLLTQHEPGNELHLVPEVTIPGGRVDYFLVSTCQHTIRDFVGIELQALDTTGSVWPERQRLLLELGVPGIQTINAGTPYSTNSRMTAKTTLVQLHHKIQTFEHLGKKLVLVAQDYLLSYMESTFRFAHLHEPANLNDSMHFHAYRLGVGTDNAYRMLLDRRLSTSAAGVAACLSPQAEAQVELEQITNNLAQKISAATLFNPFA